MDWGKLLFSYEGRINRAKFWLAIVVYIIASMIARMLGYTSGSDMLATLLNAIVSLACFISGIFVGIKRLHDRNKSAWWLLLFYVVPGALGAVSIAFGVLGVAGDSSAILGVSAILILAALAITVWMFIELACLRGTVGPNRYGPDPLAAPGAH